MWLVTVAVMKNDGDDDNESPLALVSQKRLPLKKRPYSSVENKEENSKLF